MILAILVMLAGGARSDVHQFDLIELNHSYNAEGVKCFDQVILWDWSPDYRRWHAQHWIMASDQIAVRRIADRYECRWTDGIVQLVFRAKLYRETWTIGDPERQNMKLFPVELRRKVLQ